MIVNERRAGLPLFHAQPVRSRIHSLLNVTCRKMLPRKTRVSLIEFFERLVFPNVVALNAQSPAGSVAPERAPADLWTREVLCPPVSVRPAPFPGSDLLPAAFAEETTFGEFAVLAIPEGALCGNIILDRNNCPVPGLTLARIVSSQSRRDATMRTLPPRRIDADVVAVGNTYLDNYFHWLHDIVAAILFLPDYRDRLYCGPIRHHYQMECLELLGIRRDQVINLYPGECLRFNSVLAFTAPQQGHPELVRRLSRLEQETRTTPKRIYISREDAKKRRAISNEEELNALLERHGFIRISFSELPVREQIAHMRGAEAVVMPQGAAVTNMAFCSPHTKVLELYSPKFLITLGPLFARALGHTRYQAVIGAEADPDREGATAHFRMDLGAVEAALKAFSL